MEHVSANLIILARVNEPKEEKPRFKVYQKRYDPKSVTVILFRSQQSTYFDFILVQHSEKVNKNFTDFAEFSSIFKIPGFSILAYRSFS